MKKAVLICIFGVLLSGCANSGQTEDTQTSAVSEAVTTAPKEAVTAPTETTLQKEGSPETTGATADVESTSTSISSESGEDDPETTTRKTVTSQTEAVTSVMTEPNISTTVALTESKPSETAVTTAPKIIAKPSSTASTTKKSTTASTKSTAKSSATTTTVKPKQTTTTTTTTAKTTTTATAPQPKMSLTERWLPYFGDSHDKSYYVAIGKKLKNDGSDHSKAMAVYEYMQTEFKGQRNCVYMSTITFCLCEGIGLDCGFALLSDWYNHCANAVRIGKEWYVLDTQAGGFLCADLGYTKILDEYENRLSIKLSEEDYY